MEDVKSFIIMFACLGAGAFLLSFLTQKLGIFSSIDKYDIVSTGRILERNQYKKFPGVYTVLLEYTYEGRTYREYSSIPDSPKPRNNYLEVGAVTTIYINSENPSEVTAKYLKGMGSKTHAISRQKRNRK